MRVPHCYRDVDFLRAEQGIALVVTLVGLTLFSLLALYISLSATAEIRVADNFESHMQARYAALTGLQHARALLRGIDFDDLLRGPDGQNSTSAEYLAVARTFAFRNPLDWSVARFIDGASPAVDLGELPDDGLISTGACAPAAGLPLIPGIGMPQMDAAGFPPAVRSRYFVKVTDNNGEPSELLADPSNDPFVDGDGTVLVRSMGIGSTVAELAGSAVRRNAVAVYEGRFRRSGAFALEAPLVVQGDDVRASSEPMFQGTSFQVTGESGGLGIATIDVEPANAILPAAQVASRVSEDQSGRITGNGVPAIGDVTASVAADPDKSSLLDIARLLRFVTTAPAFADTAYEADQTWDSGVPGLGLYDPALPLNDPVQKPALTYVGGNLTVSGTLSGAGLLLVKGRLVVTGSFTFSGLILVIGAGDVDLRATGLELHGGMYVARVDEASGAASWGTPALTVGGNSRLMIDRPAIRMALRLVPAEHCGFREITGARDP